MAPEEVLDNIEAFNNFADTITTIRDSLVERGWSDHNAEIAAMRYMMTFLARV